MSWFKRERVDWAQVAADNFALATETIELAKRVIKTRDDLYNLWLKALAQVNELREQLAGKSVALLDAQQYIADFEAAEKTPKQRLVVDNRQCSCELGRINGENWELIKRVKELEGELDVERRLSERLFPAWKEKHGGFPLLDTLEDWRDQIREEMKIVPKQITEQEAQS